MTEAVVDRGPGARWASPAMQDHLRRRHRSERRFQRAGVIAIALALIGLATLLASIASNGFSAFRTTQIRLDIAFDPAAFPGLAEAPESERAAILANADFAALIRAALRQ